MGAMLIASVPGRVAAVCLQSAVHLDLKQTAEGESEPRRMLSLAGEMDLRRLVDVAASHLGLRIDYDPKVLAGTVTLRSQQSLGDEELWALTNQLLASRGLVTIRAGQGMQVSIVKLSDAANLARAELLPLASEWDLIAVPASYVGVTFRPVNADPLALQRAIQPTLSRTGASVVVSADGTIQIADVRPRVVSALAMLEALDVPAALTGFVQYESRYIPAQQLAALAQEVASRMNQLNSGPELSGSLIAAPDGRHVLVIAPEGGSSRWTALLERLDQREPVTFRTYPVRWHSLTEVASLIESTIFGDDPLQAPDERERVRLDALSGAVLVSATERHHKLIEELLVRLESSTQASRRPMRTYEIRNRSANDVRGLLEQIMSRGNGNGHGAERNEVSFKPNVHHAEGAPMSLFAGTDHPVGEWGSNHETLEDTLVLTVDDSTNTLIAIGEPRQLERIEEILPLLDRRQAQVELEILLISITEGESLDLGAELEYRAKLQSTSVSLSSLFGLSTLASGVRSATGLGGTALILDPGDYAVVIRALETINRGRSLSVPKLLAGNNKPAAINAVLQQPFTSTNASSTVATTSFAGTQDAGTNVTITPTIAAGDHLVLDYRVSVSSFVGDSSAPGIPPPRQQNSVSGSVTIPDGHTIAIGGIRLSSDAKSVTQVPLLGDIPIIGEAFKNRSRSASDSRFYVFIRASILRHERFEDLKLISGKRLDEHGLEDGFPAVQPRVIP